MSYSIRRVAVLGAGTMGAGIAAHLANAGVLVYLLDIVPKELTNKENAKGLTLDNPMVRNRLAREGLTRVQATRTPGFFSSRFVERVSVGNLEDHFDWVEEADWVIEAVVEDLEIKREIMARIEKVRRKGSIVTTNTSGLQLKEISEGTSKDFGQHFLGTHFFNPPRQMKLLEIIPGPQTKPVLLDFMIRFSEENLGKGVVVCKDTPNFIANRIASIQGSFDMEHVVSQGYTVEEADAVLGPPIGRPTTALFRLRDLVGLDVSQRVRENLYQMIPHDAYRETLIAPHANKLRKTMIERGLLGRKSGQGFYKQVDSPKGRQFFGLDLETVEHREPRSVELPGLEKASEIRDLAERLRFMISLDDRVGDLVWASLQNVLRYAAYCIPEIADDLVSIDRAMRWGYSWELGPFEVWDSLCVADTLPRMEAEGHTVVDWVKEMVEGGCSSFYEKRNGQILQYDLSAKGYKPVPQDPRILPFAVVKSRPNGVVQENTGASLIDLGDGAACLEFHTKANTLDETIYQMMESSLEIVDRDFVGLVIGNQGRHFSAGANLQLLLERAREGRFDDIESSVRNTQERCMAFRFFQKPVVAACFGMALGGGVEVVMAASRVCAAAESYIGLVETGVGLIPSAGGCKELLRRVASPPMHSSGVDPLSFVRQVFETVAFGKVSNSAEEAREMGFLSEGDSIVMNQDHVLAQAKDMVLKLASSEYRPPTRERSVFAMGQRGKAVLEVSIFHLREAGRIREHQAVINKKIAHVLCGGDLTAPQWVDEQYILDLEREALVSLSGETKTQERIEYFLNTGKRLSN